MDLTEAINNILEGHAILFAGAGFTHGAKNSFGESIPLAKQIKQFLLDDLGICDSTHNLEAISDYYIQEKSETDLINILKRKYCVEEVSNYHKSILSSPWKRIYTTNYDRTIELASQQSFQKRILTPITLDKNFDEQNKQNICIHLNGFIDNLNLGSLHKEFKLTDRSYSCNVLNENPWYELMINDFNSTSAIIVIGYSLEFDIDIKRILSAPKIKSKTVFINSPNIDNIAHSMIKNYGSCYPIGIEKFGEEIDKARKIFIPSTNNSFKSFNREIHNTIESLNPNFTQILNFFNSGVMDKNLFHKNTLNEYTHLVYRESLNIILRNYKAYKVFLILSDLGNGKTTFCELLKDQLSSYSVYIFTYNHRYVDIDDEIQEICNETKKDCIVIIDNYPGHLDLLKKFYYYGHSNITFILTVRFSMNNKFYRQLLSSIHIKKEEIKPIYLNKLNEKEIKSLAKKLERTSLMTMSKKESMTIEEYLEVKCDSKFSNILLKLFDSEDIKNRLTILYKKASSNPEIIVRETIIFSLIHTTSNLDLSFVEALDLLGADFMNFTKLQDEVISEIFDFSDGYINIKSSIIAKEILRSVINIKDIVDVMIKIFLIADNRIGTTYNELKKAMVSHSQFVMYSKNSNNKYEASVEIERFYDSIRNTKFAANNPHFWEQFACAYLDMENYSLARKCLDIALDKANSNSHFVPFQIVTVRGRLFTEECLSNLREDRIDSANTIDIIFNTTKEITRYYNHPDNNPYYVFKVARNFPAIYNLVRNKLNVKALQKYLECSKTILNLIDSYIKNNTYDQYIFNIIQWRKEISISYNDAKSLLYSNKTNYKEEKF